MPERGVSVKESFDGAMCCLSVVPLHQATIGGVSVNKSNVGSIFLNVGIQDLRMEGEL